MENNNAHFVLFMYQSLYLFPIRGKFNDLWKTIMLTLNQCINSETKTILARLLLYNCHPVTTNGKKTDGRDKLSFFCVVYCIYGVKEG